MKTVLLSPPPTSSLSSARSLRGVAAELEDRGHEVVSVAPAAGLERADRDALLDDADLVLVHDACNPETVAAVGAHRGRHDGYRLLIYVTDRRAEANAAAGGRFDLAGYDGVLAGDGEIRQAYVERGWDGRAWVWHEAADPRIFHPLPETEPTGDLVWIGRGEAAGQGAALRDLLLRPSRQLRLRGSVHASRLSRATRLAVRLAGLHCCPAAAEAEIAELFSRHRLTVHIPAGNGGGASVRPLEALACGIPLISTPWDDYDELLRPEQDYLVAR